MTYHINEIFYTLKGEGQWTGTPMTFIRLSGCNLKCEFCDTDHRKKLDLSTAEIIKEIEKYPAQRICITGGEPLLQDLTDLVKELHNKHYHIHLETNGTRPLEDIPFDWIAVSPKTSVTMLYEDTMQSASEIKFLVGGPNWQHHIEQCVVYWELFQSQSILYLMPIAKSAKVGDKTINDIIQENVQQAVQFCKETPIFNLCLQMHKYIGIP